MMVISEEERAALEEKIRRKLAEKERLRKLRVRTTTKESSPWNAAVVREEAEKPPAADNGNSGELLLPREANSTTAPLLEEIRILRKENMDLREKLQRLEEHGEIVKKVEEAIGSLKSELGEASVKNEMLEMLSDMMRKLEEREKVPVVAGNEALVVECEALKSELRVLQEKLDYYERDRQLLLEQIEALNASLKNLTEFLNKVQRQRIEQPQALSPKPKKKWWQFWKRG